MTKKMRYLVLMMLMLMLISANVSAASYTVKVQRAGIVNVYRGKKLVRKMWCSCGLPETPTPKGTFYTSNTYRWHTLLGPTYGQYCTRIYRGIMFHSTLYREYGNRDSLIASSYNNLGYRASHGCIRLRVADAKYIYNLARKQSIKVVISDKKLSRPARIGTISEDACHDPSDN